MGWEISESSLSPTYVDDPIDWWYSDFRNPDSNFEQDNYPNLGQATAELLHTLNEALEYAAADEKVGPLPKGYVEKQIVRVAKDVLREYGLSVGTYMSELERRTSPSWRYRTGLWDLEILTTK